MLCRRDAAVRPQRSHTLRQVTEIVTFVEMTAESQLVPAASVPGLTLEPVDRDSPLVPSIMARIGAPHGWRSASRTEAQWAAWFAEHPGLMVWLLWYEGEPAGLVSCELHPGGDAEIVTFGLVPEFVGKGLGGYALTLGTRQAWTVAPSVNRVWLHTSTQDHLRALPNYHRRGFRTFRTEQRQGD
jgi:RimJ/RimL family protein N-acetyltransferase